MSVYDRLRVIKTQRPQHLFVWGSHPECFTIVGVYHIALQPRLCESYCKSWKKTDCQLSMITKLRKPDNVHINVNFSKHVSPQFPFSQLNLRCQVDLYWLRSHCFFPSQDYRFRSVPKLFFFIKKFAERFWKHSSWLPVTTWLPLSALLWHFSHLFPMSWKISALLDFQGWILVKNMTHSQCE